MLLLALLLALSPVQIAQQTTVTVSGTVATLNSIRHEAYCSGFVVRKDGDTEIVATARHCVLPTDDEGLKVIPDPEHVTFENGQTSDVERVYVDPDHDLALLRVDTRSGDAVSFTDYVRRGQELFVYGMPAGMTWVYSQAYSMRGTDYSEAGDPWNATWVISCPSCYGGDSGGPTFNMNGEVVGMIVASSDAPPAALIVPSQIIQKFLDQVK